MDADRSPDVQTKPTMLKNLRSLFGRKPAATNDPRESFAVEVAEFLKTLPTVREVTWASEEYGFDVVTSTGSTRLYLENAFAESSGVSPEERRQVIARFFTELCDAEKDESWEAARATLLLAPRGATYGMKGWMKKPGATPIRQPFLPFVDVLVAMDRPNSISLIGRGMVEDWKIAEREVFEVAAARTALLANAPVELYDETHGPLWIVASDDSYQSSRLLVPGWLASFRGRVAGNPIAIIPQRATVMVGGDGRPEMVERLLEEAEREFHSSTRRLSPALYTVDAAGEVVPYAVSRPDGLATKVKMAHENLATHEYREQQEALDALHEDRRHEVFVAGYHTFERGGSVSSVCVWTKGVPSYLPRTERVALGFPVEARGRKPKPTVEVSFDAILGRLSLLPDLHPARYETTGDFPTDAELRSLASES